MLISDGRATTGDAAQEAARLEAEGIPVDVVVVDPPAGTDVAVGGIDVPSLARKGEEIDVDVRVGPPGPPRPRWCCAATTAPRWAARPWPWRPGPTPCASPTPPPARACCATRPRSPPPATPWRRTTWASPPCRWRAPTPCWWWPGGAGAGDGLVSRTAGGGSHRRDGHPGHRPAIDELTRYASIVLADVDRRDLSDAQVADLTAAVRDLGRGLVVVGGTHSYALGGYRDSDLEQILPVVSEITDPCAARRWPRCWPSTPAARWRPATAARRA